MPVDLGATTQTDYSLKKRIRVVALKTLASRYLKEHSAWEQEGVTAVRDFIDWIDQIKGKP